MRLYDLQPGDWIRGWEIAPVTGLKRLSDGTEVTLQAMPQPFRGKITRRDYSHGNGELYWVLDERLFRGIEVPVHMDRMSVEEVIFAVP